VKDTEVTAGLAESNGSLLPGLWRDSLHVTCWLTACTPGWENFTFLVSKQVSKTIVSFAQSRPRQLGHWRFF